MAKASLWMHKSELQKIAELSGDMSLNVFLMQIIRKSLANELKGVESENKNKKKMGVRGLGVESEPTTTASTFVFVNQPTAKAGGPTVER